MLLNTCSHENSSSLNLSQVSCGCCLTRSLISCSTAPCARAIGDLHRDQSATCYACAWPLDSARMCRAPARLRTSLVPSSISEARASRNIFSTGYSLLSPLPPKICKASLVTSNAACVQKVFAAIACWSEGAPDELL